MKCFVVMPIGELGTEKHKEFLSVYENIIKNTVESMGIVCERADEIAEYGVITEQIKVELHKADLVIADLTDRNPNVLYEMGIRHTLSKPIICIAQDVRGLPFDVSQYRTIHYDPRDSDSISKFQKLLKSYIENLGTFRQEHSTVKGLDEKLLYYKLRFGIEDLYRIAELGFVGIYRNRADAIESHFFKVISDEEEQIDIAGSTLFALRGYWMATFDRIIDILKTKCNSPAFTLRILLTHWDFVSLRQNQERNDKNVSRWKVFGVSP